MSAQIAAGQEIDRYIQPDANAALRVQIARKFMNVKPEITGDEIAVVETNKGTFKFVLYPDSAPATVESFVRLAELGFYDGLTFHRYVPNFVIQGGDPKGDGTGDAGYTVPLEARAHHVEGAVGLARAADPNSGSCQFYITLSPQPHLDGNYTVFGRVIEGMDVVRKLRKGDKILRITIERGDQEK